VNSVPANSAPINLSVAPWGVSYIDFQTPPAFKGTFRIHIDPVNRNSYWQVYVTENGPPVDYPREYDEMWFDLENVSFPCPAPVVLNYDGGTTPPSRGALLRNDSPDVRTFTLYSDSEVRKDNGLSAGAIAGIAVGAVALVAVIIIVGVLIYKKKKAKMPGLSYDPLMKNGPQAIVDESSAGNLAGA
jgi:hypothetical protein